METKTDLLNSAIEIERKSIELYQEFSRQTIVEELSSIFQFLAAEEKSHYEILKAWRENADAPVLDESQLIADPENVFQKLADHFNIYGVPATHYYNAYDKARIFEEKSIAFYENLDEQIPVGQKIILMKIIDQEKKHAQFLKNLLEFVRHPGEWLENAEWYHLEEY
jgi:rubrerythrin